MLQSRIYFQKFELHKMHAHQKMFKDLDISLECKLGKFLNSNDGTWFSQASLHQFLRKVFIPGIRNFLPYDKQACLHRKRKVIIHPRDKNISALVHKFFIHKNGI